MVFSPSGTKWKEVGGSGREWKKVGANGARQKSTGTTLGGFAQLERPWVSPPDLRVSIHIHPRIPVPPAALPRTILVTYYVLRTAWRDGSWQSLPWLKELSLRLLSPPSWAPWTWGPWSRAGDLGKDLSRVIIYVSVPVQLRHLIHLRHLRHLVDQGCHWLQ